MTKITPLDRILLLITGLLAAYQVAIGIDGFATLPIIAYTIAFGIILVAGLLLIILGFDVLDSPVIVVVSTIIPLSLALGLVWQHLPSIRIPYLIFAHLGFLAILITRAIKFRNKLPIMVITLVHGIAGITIFLLPIALSATGKMDPAFSLVGIGGALIGVGGLLLSFLKAGKPILSRKAIFRILPGLLLLMTSCYVIGFRYG